MSISTRWAVAHEPPVPPTALTAQGTIDDAFVADRVDAACRAYLDGCPVLEATRADGGLELRATTALVLDPPLPAAPSLVVTVSATEVLPRAFVLAIRIRTLGAEDRVVNGSRRVELVDPATGTAQELGTAIRDELIAIEHAARHFN
jgi:hypothetical protein